MARPPRIYEKLGKRAGLATYSSLWLATDHLMLVRSTGFTEQYQRFQLSDIQAFLITPSDRRQNWALAWVVVGLIALIPLTVALVQRETPIVSGVFLALVVVGLLVNGLLGPACNVLMVTRVQTTRFPLVRRRTTDKVLARLQPLITAAQADLIGEATLESAMPPPLT